MKKYLNLFVFRRRTTKLMRHHIGKKLTLSILLSLICAASYAGDGVRFAYDLYFDFNFDNREFNEGAFKNSMTVFGARLTPTIGVDFKQNSKFTHRLMAGIDIMKDFGASPVPVSITGDPDAAESSPKLNNASLFREITIYYNLNADFGKTKMNLYAGIFPRRFCNEKYPDAFRSDSLDFYDNNLEGLLLTFHRPKAKYEVGCDWIGQYGTFRRERFQLFTSGLANVAGPFSLGWYAVMDHYACSSKVGGVFDNILVNPYARLNFAKWTGMQELSLTLGWMQALQQDRSNVGHYVFPFGCEVGVRAKKWNVLLEYRLFAGKDLMPYYDSFDASGVKYGSNLYWGDPLYRSPLYNRLELRYEPVIWESLKISVGAVAHFCGNSFAGWQQKVGITFDLERLLKCKSQKRK